VGQRGCADAALSTPSAPVEDAGDGCHQHITPVEVNGALVPVCEAEDDCRREQRQRAAHAALEKVLQPPAKEEFLRDGDEQKCEDEGRDGAER